MTTPQNLTLTAGSYINLTEDSSASTISVNSNINFVAGSGITIASSVSASTVTISNTYPERTAFLPLNTSASLVGTEKNYVRIPSFMNGWCLTAANASCSGSSTSGSPSFIIYRSSASSTTLVSMLTTNISIDQGEFDSSTALSSAVISTTASMILTGDKVWAYSSGSSTCGTGVTYAGVSATFKKV